MSVPGKEQRAEAEKTKGNEYFKAGDLQGSAHAFQVWRLDWRRRLRHTTRARKAAPQHSCAFAVKYRAVQGCGAGMVGRTSVQRRRSLQSHTYKPE
jgi:hypothetical protein